MLIILSSWDDHLHFTLTSSVLIWSGHIWTYFCFLKTTHSNLRTFICLHSPFARNTQFQILTWLLGFCPSDLNTSIKPLEISLDHLNFSSMDSWECMSPKSGSSYAFLKYVSEVQLLDYSINFSPLHNRSRNSLK